MKAFFRQQLDRYAARLGELEFLLSREDIMKDMDQFLVLSREHSDVAAVAGRWARYSQREADLGAASDLFEASRSEPEMAAMAQEEIDDATSELGQL
ncbi:MAG: PCRF domain-containing protein, partial [Rhodoferax sp.]|nr:PCRF domain-containing protein [Rhodoferax sp.]